MIILKGNLLETPFEVIAHQVNCLGIMGGGVALQIKNTTKNVYPAYKANVDALGDGMFGLGQVVVEGNGHIYFNIFGQRSIGSGCQTDYEKFKKAFVMAIDEYRSLGCGLGEVKELQATIAIPYMIGCGLAGGDWNIVSKILEDIEKEYNVVFVAYKL